MSEFSVFSKAVTNAFNTMIAKDDGKKMNLFIVDITGDELYDHYLASFPEGTNKMFRERTEHDCSTCRNFIKNIGNVVYVKGDEFRTVWDSILGLGEYDVVADAMSKLVRSKAIKSAFFVGEPSYGAATTKAEDGTIWNHFYASVPRIYQFKHNGSNVVGLRNDDVAILKRSITELTDASVDIVEELIDQGSLYRGDEYKHHIKLLKTLKVAYNKLKTDRQREVYLWTTATPSTRIRNTVIGALLVDLSADIELEVAVGRYESHVAPANFKRPKALVTQKMIDEAKKQVDKLGIEDALARRYAVREDISVNDILFVNGSVKPKLLGGAFDSVKPTKKGAVPELKNVDNISVEDFINNVLPKADEVELFIKNNLVGNFVSLVAPVHAEAASLFKWDSKFSWSYSGELADSDIRRAVQAKGGRVDGVLRFSHSWNYDKRNASLMDLHVFMPGCKHESGKHDRYGLGGQRVGWNNRSDAASGGRQDVDYVEAAPIGYVPVENITFPDIKRLKDGEYQCKIHNWNLRQPTLGGFKAEIEFAGQVFEYEYDKPLGHKEWVDVATITLKNGVFSIVHHMPCGASSKDMWNIKTEEWAKVDMVMRSPNFWGGKQTGNQHVFFMLKDCVNPEGTRGFYNEFLRDDLTAHRKVFELLGSSLKVPANDNQLSGVGISTTKKEEVLIRVKGSINRVLNVVF
jgi:putative heme iron utilization protein